MTTLPERARDARHAIAAIVIAHGGQWSGAVDAAVDAVLRKAFYAQRTLRYPNADEVLAALDVPRSLPNLCDVLGVPFADRHRFANARLGPMRKAGLIEAVRNGSYPVWRRKATE